MYVGLRGRAASAAATAAQATRHSARTALATGLSRRAMSAAAGSDKAAGAGAAGAGGKLIAFDGTKAKLTLNRARGIPKSQVRIESVFDWEDTLRKQLYVPGSYERGHDTSVAAEDAPRNPTSVQQQRRRRAAVQYRLLNTSFAKAMTPEQDPAVQDLHVIRLGRLRALMGTAKKQDAYKHKYTQRPIRVDFNPPSRSLSETKHPEKDKQWIVPLLEQYQRDLSRSVNPWPIGKQEQFLQTARKVLYKRFNHSKLVPFQHMRPLPPAAPGTTPTLSRGAGAGASL